MSDPEALTVNVPVVNVALPGTPGPPMSVSDHPGGRGPPEGELTALERLAWEHLWRRQIEPEEPGFPTWCCKRQ